MNADLDDATKIRAERIKASVDLEQSLHELTTKELLYFMAKILEELTRREKNR